VRRSPRACAPGARLDLGAERVSRIRQSASGEGQGSAEIFDFVSGEAAQVIGAAEPAEAKVDPDDARVLGEALAGQAELFVTGDAALHRLATIGGLRSVSPRQFWEVLHARER